MKIPTLRLMGVAAAMLVGCGDDSNSATASGSATDSATGIDSVSGTDTAQTDSVGSQSGSSATGSGGSAPTTDSSSATESASVSGSSTGEPGTDGSTSMNVSGSSTGASNDTGSSDTGGCPGGGGTEVLDFSYIWIANSTQGTVSKIDTQTAVEVGRYLVDDYEDVTIDDCQGPSRTSVNLAGDVAVLDRSGGLAKIIADEENCVDSNANGMIDTATDANYLPWQQDECLAWQLDVPHDTGNGCGGPRTVQWTAPEQTGECEYDDPKVWVAFCNEADDDVTVWLVDGADGTVEVEIPVEGYQCSTYGPYGGAVDAENNLWFVDRSSGQSLYRVDYGCVPANPGDCWTEYPQPAGLDAYGITIGANGLLWIAGSSNSLYSFDPVTETYTSYQTELNDYFATVAPADSNPTNTLRGLMSDENGILWIASINQGAWSGGTNPGLLRVDPTANPPVIEFYGPDTLTGIQHAAGISIDVDGYVWLVDTLGDQAFKIDPDNPNLHTVVSGLQYPYTYSDMTGFALKQIVPG